MDRLEAIDNLQAYLDGELNPDAADQVKKLIDNDQFVIEEYQRLIRLKEILNELREVEVPPGNREKFIDELQSRINREKKTGFTKVINWRPLYAAAFVIASILFVLFIVPKPSSNPAIEPASGLNQIQNMKIDALVMGTLDLHFLSTTGEFMADPVTSGGKVAVSWKVVKNTHGDMFEQYE
ncbi:MAG TPA: hypothetical protein VGB30_07310 [bacterium]|jgi:anti-sigma factor RsiW